MKRTHGKRRKGTGMSLFIHIFKRIFAAGKPQSSQKPQLHIISNSTYWWIQGESRLRLTEGLRMWLRPSGGKWGVEMSGGWTKCTPKSSSPGPNPFYPKDNICFALISPQTHRTVPLTQLLFIADSLCCTVETNILLERNYCCCCSVTKVKWSNSVMSDSLRPHGP